MTVDLVMGMDGAQPHPALCAATKGEAVALDRDSWTAKRALKALSGLMAAARALGTLDLGDVSRLLAPLGLASQDSDLDGLHDGLQLPPGGQVTALRALPWAGPARLAGTALCVHGRAARVDAALRLAAGHARGRVGARIQFEDGASALDAVSDLLELHDDGESGLTLVVGPPLVTVDLVSPAPRDLVPVLQVMANRDGWPAPDASPDAAYALLQELLSKLPGMRDERAANDARVGVHLSAGAAWVHLQELDGGAVDARIEDAVKHAQGGLLALDAEAFQLLAPSVLGRVRSALVLAPAVLSGSIMGEIPGRVVRADTFQTATNLLADPALNPRDLPQDLSVTVGETAVVAPSSLLAGVARRASGESKAAVLHEDAADAVFLLQQARLDGALPSRCKMSVGVYDSHRPNVARAMAAAFLAANLGPDKRASAAPPASRKIRIRG